MKARQARQRSSSSGSDSGVVVKTKAKSVPAKRGLAKLSFADDEDGEDSGFSMGNRSTRKQFKKMVQAPLVPQPSEDNQTLLPSQGGSGDVYSAAAMASLRQKQQYKPDNTITTKAATNTTTTTQNINDTNAPEAAILDVKAGMQLEGEDAERALRQLGHGHMGNSVENESDEEFMNVDVAMDDDIEATTQPKVKQYTTAASAEHTSPSQSALSSNELLTLLSDDLEVQQEKLQQISLKISSIEGQITSHDNEIKIMRTSEIQPLVTRLNALLAMHTYMDAFVSLVRTKEDSVNQLYHRCLELLSENKDKFHRKRVDVVEDKILEVRASILQQKTDQNRYSLQWTNVNSTEAEIYQPIAGLLQDVESSCAVEEQVDEFGRSVDMRSHDSNSENNRENLSLKTLEERKLKRNMRHKIKYIPYNDPKCIEEWDMTDEDTEDTQDIEVCRTRSAMLSQASDVLMEDTGEKYANVSSFLHEMTSLRLTCHQSAVSSSITTSSTSTNGERHAENMLLMESPYQKMYMSLSLPPLLGPHIMLEILKPILSAIATEGITSSTYLQIFDINTFAQSLWHTSVLEYQSTDPHEEDADSDKTLMLRIILEVYLPWLRSCIKNTIDPLNIEQNGALLDLLRGIYDIGKKYSSSIHSSMKLASNLCDNVHDIIQTEILQLYKSDLLGAKGYLTLLPYFLHTHDNEVLFQSLNCQSRIHLNRTDISACEKLDISTKKSYIAVATSQYSRLCAFFTILYKYTQIHDDQVDMVKIEFMDDIQRIVKQVIQSNAIKYCTRSIIGLSLYYNSQQHEINIKYSVEYDNALRIVPRLYHIFDKIIFDKTKNNIGFTINKLCLPEEILRGVTSLEERAV
jgi:hypothetical protein